MQKKNKYGFIFCFTIIWFIISVLGIIAVNFILKSLNFKQSELVKIMKCILVGEGIFILLDYLRRKKDI